MNERLRIEPGNSSLLCPLCKEETTSQPTAVCPSCETAYHEACIQELGGCATLGCEQKGRVFETRGRTTAAEFEFVQTVKRLFLCSVAFALIILFLALGHNREPSALEILALVPAVLFMSAVGWYCVLKRCPECDERFYAGADLLSAHPNPFRSECIRCGASARGT